MTLEVGIEKVSTAIKGTMAPFKLNKPAVNKAEKVFGVFTEKARETVRNYENKVAYLSAQVANLRREAAEATECLNRSNAVIQYQNTKITNAKELVRKQEKIINRFKERRSPNITFLEDGNILESETKWNGAELQVEKTPKGRKVGYKIISADKTAQRSGTFDEITQRRLSTYTKNEHGEATITYDIAGNADSVVAEEAKLPKLVSSDISTDNRGTRTLKETFDDGTVVISQRYKGGGRMEKLDKDNHSLELLYENNDYKKTTIDHYKYKNNRAYIKETTIKSPDSESIFKKYTKNLAYDINGKSYSQKTVIESPLGKITGKVSKTDKFGDLEEYVIKADLNPSEKINWNSYKSVEGKCGIKFDRNSYTLVPKEYKITMNNGNQYIIKHFQNGRMNDTINVNGGHEQNVDAVIKELELEQLIEV